MLAAAVSSRATAVLSPDSPELKLDGLNGLSSSNTDNGQSTGNLSQSAVLADERLRQGRTALPLILPVGPSGQAGLLPEQ